jgi:hypothetical protein
MARAVHVGFMVDRLASRPFVSVESLIDPPSPAPV